MTAPLRARTLQTSGGGVPAAQAVSVPEEFSPNAANDKSTSCKGSVSPGRLTGIGFWFDCGNFPGSSLCARANADWNGRVLFRSGTGSCSNLHGNPGTTCETRDFGTDSNSFSSRCFGNLRNAGAGGIHTPQGSACSPAECGEQGPLDSRAAETACISRIGAVEPASKVRGFPAGGRGVPGNSLAQPAPLLCPASLTDRATNSCFQRVL